MKDLYVLLKSDNKYDRILAWSGIAMVADGIFMLGTFLVYSDFMKHW